MNKNTLLRTAAILYADESTVINPNMIKRKMIESIFLEIKNEKVAIDELVDLIKEHIGLEFTEEETIGIINLFENGYFDILQKEDPAKAKVRLSEQRYTKVIQKTEKLTLEDFIEIYASEIFEGEIESKEIKEIIYRYIYYLINTNHNTLTKILTGKHSEGDISLCSTEFEENERDIINQFINWNHTEKNKALFVIISYSIEYCLIANNAANDEFVNSLKDKIFYIDSNIIFRAIGVNGRNRQVRIRAFIEKCIKSGQTFKISKFTDREFHMSLKYHIEQLKSFPSAKINPEVFRRFHLRSEFYEFYYDWRIGRSAASFELFHLHIKGLYDSFRKEFNIETLTKVPDEIDTPEIANKIKTYLKGIEAEKNSWQTELNTIDAKNIALIELFRGGKNHTLLETETYLISTDQKLRAWDFSRTEDQPVILLPSQWMSLLLRYVSRSDSDFNAFSSFLSIKNGGATIKVDNLEYILTGISNITEDFESQAIVIDRMIEQKFDRILEGKTEDEILETVENFTEKELDIQLKAQKEKGEQEKIQLQRAHNNQLADLSNEKDKENERIALEGKIHLLEESEKEKALRLQDKEEYRPRLFKQKQRLDKKAKVKLNTRKTIFITALIVYYLILIAFIIYYKWDVMEPYISFLGPAGFVISIVYLLITGKSINLGKYVKELEEKIKNRTYDEYGFDIAKYNELASEIKNIKTEITEIQREIIQRKSQLASLV